MRFGLASPHQVAWGAIHFAPQAEDVAGVRDEREYVVAGHGELRTARRVGAQRGKVLGDASLTRWQWTRRFRAIALTEGEFVAVEVVDEDPHVHRLDASMLFLSGEAGVGTRGCGGIHCTQTPRIRTPDMYQRTHTFGREPCWPGIHIRCIS